MSGFTRKLIELTITLGTGDFGADTGDTVTISDSRIFADLVNPGGESMGAAQIRVYGLDQTLMNKLTTIGQINRAIRVKNTVTVAAGDENGMQLVFFGVIADAWGEYNSAPDVPFVIMANAGLDIAVKPVNATSYKGSVSAQQIMLDLAAEAGLAFEGDDVEVQLFNPYFPGTTLNKIRSCARAAGIEYAIDRGTLSVWRNGKSRVGTVPLISEDAGMIGYPTLSSKGLTVRCMFNQNIQIGADIEIASSIPMANGKWHVFNVAHNISSQAPGGPWETKVEAYRVES
jgi:hypothetical protein